MIRRYPPDLPDYLPVMQFAAGPPSRWVVHLKGGGEAVVWADSAEGLSGEDDLRDYAFYSLMDIDPADQVFFEVAGRTPSNPRRVLVTVAYFPRETVERVSG